MAVSARKGRSGDAMAGNLEDKVCLITGSTGIAEATALQAVEQGARVFVVSRTQENCRGLADKLGESGGSRHPADSRNWHSAVATFSTFILGPSSVSPL